MTQATPTACRGVKVLSIIAVVKVPYTDLVVEGKWLSQQVWRDSRVTEVVKVRLQIFDLMRKSIFVPPSHGLKNEEKVDGLELIHTCNTL